jgi:hypothetical protein
LGGGALALNLLIAFELYPASLLWNAFLHPKWGSLIWMAIPFSAFLIVGVGPLLGLVSTPRRLVIDGNSATFEFKFGRRTVHWEQFRRPIISLGGFGATVRYVSSVNAHRSVPICLSADQAEAIAALGRPERWGWAPDLSENAITRAFQGRYKCA